GYQVQLPPVAARYVVTPRKLAGTFCAPDTWSRCRLGSPAATTPQSAPGVPHARLPQPSMRSTAVASKSNLFVTGDDQLRSANSCGRNWKVLAASGPVPPDPRSGH